MKKAFLLLAASLLLASTAPARRSYGADTAKESRFVKNVRRLTKGKEGEKSGEAYFSPDGKQVIYQSVRDGQPYYQIYVVPTDGGEPRLVSTGKGKTTCAYFHPTEAGRFLYASTHLDEKTHAPPPKDDAKGGRSYKWDYDPSMDIFSSTLADPAKVTRLTDANGYDAEASWSHDGKRICFTSSRDGANAIFVMDSDGKNVARVSPAKDSILAGGGPFFMPDDAHVLYRAQDAKDPRSPMHVFVSSLDGKDVKQLTRAPRMNWCPFPHPDGKKVVYAAALEGHRNFELFLIRTDGSFREVRLTWSDGFDALPSFSADGKKLLWTSTRDGGASDVYVADFVEPAETDYEVQTDQPEAAPEHGHGGGTNPHGGENPHGSGGEKNPHGPSDHPKAPATDPHGDGAFAPKLQGVIKGSQGPAREIAGADHLEELGLVEDVKWLADPEREGRRAGTPGEMDAARYVQARFQTLGVAPGGPDGSYVQPFTVLAGAQLVAEKCFFMLEQNARGFQLGKDWRPLLYSGNGEVTAPLVFCGYGIEDKDRGYDDYASVDVKGKIAVVYTRGPRSDKGGAFGSDHPLLSEDIRFKVSLARHKGAAAVAFIRNEGDAWLELGYGDPGIPVIQLARGTFLDLFGYSTDTIKGMDLEALRKEIDEKLEPRSRPMGRQRLKAPEPFEPWTAKIQVSTKKVTAESRNVIGRIEGTEPSRDVIVIGAHMDHLGHGGDGSLAPGSKAIHPGADDNASGVSGVLALARALKAAPLKHTVLICTFGGEEMGLLGSAHLVKQPPLRLERVEAMLNMDMIGRLGSAPLVVGGAGTAKEWPKVLETAARAAQLDVAPSKDGFGPSDHASFYGKGIPVFFLFTRSHSDYHKPSDTADKIDGTGLAKVTRFALALLREIDGLPARPSFEKAGADPHSQGVVTGERGPWFGSVPDYAEGEEGGDGVKIQGVRPGSPAEKAGLKAGDRIVEFAGRAIKNIYDYTAAIRGAKAGKPVKVVVQRDGKKVDLEATLIER